MSLSASELTRLRAACDQLADGPDYRSDDFIENMMLTALDFQLRVEVVNKAMKHFFDTHGFRRARELTLLMAQYPDTRSGNTLLAKKLWNCNLWTRAKFLRALIGRFEERGVRGQRSLVHWLTRADFDRDIKGQIRTAEHSIGYTIYSWLRLRCGFDTVKPDLHVLKFVEHTIGRKVSPEEAVSALRKVAKLSRRKAHRLDSAIWHFQHG